MEAIDDIFVATVVVANREMFQLQPSTLTGGFITTLVSLTEVPMPIHRRKAKLVKMPKKPPCYKKGGKTIIQTFALC